MSVTILDDFTYTTQISNTGEVTTVSEGGASTPSLPPTSGVTDEIKNAISAASVTAEDDGSITFNGGITHKVTKLAAAAVSVFLNSTQHIVYISNINTTSVFLPAATVAGQRFLVVRDYALQGGETIIASVLSLYPNGTNTIEGDASVPIPAMFSVEVVSDGTGTWKIV
jgi:hypothetical protein